MSPQGWVTEEVSHGGQEAVHITGAGEATSCEVMCRLLSAAVSMIWTHCSWCRAVSAATSRVL